ncbi:hypothetical protein STEG23_030905, partial [Scotinomys teguina]
NDLLMVCRQLNMEESVTEIMNQLGTDESGKMSFQDFTRCHMQLVGEIRREEIDLSLMSDKSRTKKLRNRISSWPTSSDNSPDQHRRARSVCNPLHSLTTTNLGAVGELQGNREVFIQEPMNLTKDS